jgi:hypothetical protein
MSAIYIRHAAIDLEAAMLSPDTVQAITENVQNVRANLNKGEQAAFDAFLGAFAGATAKPLEVEENSEALPIVKEIWSLGSRLVTIASQSDRAVSTPIITTITITTILTSHPIITCRAIRD